MFAAFVLNETSFVFFVLFCFDFLSSSTLMLQLLFFSVNVVQYHDFLKRLFTLCCVFPMLYTHNMFVFPCRYFY